MSDSEATETTTETTEQSSASAPPWGSEEDFNAEKAWNLIQNLRNDLGSAKEKVAAAAESEAKLRELEDAKLSEQDRLTRDLTESQTEAADLRSEVALLKAVIEHGLESSDIELLQGLPAEAIADRAAKLAARVGAGTPTKPLAARPAEALRGGADPTKPIKQDGDWLRDAFAAKS